jgi:hypothetical protein
MNPLSNTALTTCLCETSFKYLVGTSAPTGNEHGGQLKKRMESRGKRSRSNGTNAQSQSETNNFLLSCLKAAISTSDPFNYVDSDPFPKRETTCASAANVRCIELGLAREVLDPDSNARHLAIYPQ